MNEAKPRVVLIVLFFLGLLVHHMSQNDGINDQFIDIKERISALYSLTYRKLQQISHIKQSFNKKPIKTSNFIEDLEKMSEYAIGLSLNLKYSEDDFINHLKKRKAIMNEPLKYYGSSDLNSKEILEIKEIEKPDDFLNNESDERNGKIDDISQGNDEFAKNNLITGGDFQISSIKQLTKLSHFTSNYETETQNAQNNFRLCVYER